MSFSVPRLFLFLSTDSLYLHNCHCMKCNADWDFTAKWSGILFSVRLVLVYYHLNSLNVTVTLVGFIVSGCSWIKVNLDCHGEILTWNLTLSNKFFLWRNLITTLYWTLDTLDRATSTQQQKVIFLPLREFEFWQKALSWILCSFLSFISF